MTEADTDFSESPKEQKKIKTTYEKLSEIMPKEAIQTTKKELTKKGYDTVGYGYQYLVNRFNEILGFENWGYDYKIVREKAGNFKSGMPFSEITVELGIWVQAKDNVRKCAGGHISTSYSDALKGAITNAFKKTAGFWGVGRQAFEGSIDDDTILEDEIGNKAIDKADADFSEPPKEQKTDTKEKPITKNFKFLEGMAKQKERIGEQKYYEILGLAEFKKSNEIIDEDMQLSIFNQLKKEPTLIIEQEDIPI